MSLDEMTVGNLFLKFKKFLLEINLVSGIPPRKRVAVVTKIWRPSVNVKPGNSLIPQKMFKGLFLIFIYYCEATLSF